MRCLRGFLWRRRVERMTRGVSERLAHARDDLGPIAGAGLAMDEGVGIPRGVFAFFHPAQVGEPGQQQMAGLGERAGEVGDGVVDADDGVAVLDQSEHALEVVQVVDVVEVQRRHAGLGAQSGAFGGGVAVLQIDEDAIGHGQQREQFAQRERTVGAGLDVLAVPGQTNDALAAGRVRRRPSEPRAMAVSWPPA